MTETIKIYHGLSCDAALKAIEYCSKADYGNNEEKLIYLDAVDSYLQLAFEFKKSLDKCGDIDASKTLSKVLNIGIDRRMLSLSRTFAIVPEHAAMKFSPITIS